MSGVKDLVSRVDELYDALDHIARVCENSSQQTRRIKWIRERAVCAIDGNDDWKDVVHPPNLTRRTLTRSIRHFQKLLDKYDVEDAVEERYYEE